MPNQTAAMLVIGDEILSGRTRDSNMHHLAMALTEHGLQLCEARVVADDHEAIVAAVNAEAFSENKQSALQMAAAGKFFTVEQVGKLVDLFSFSEDKLNAVKQVKGQIVDPQNNFKLLTHFTFSSDKEELKKILGR